MIHRRQRAADAPVGVTGEPDGIDAAMERAEVVLARRTTRRSFFGRLGRGFLAVAGGSFVAVALDPERARAFHLCGHIWTTGSCPHPYYPRTRIDTHGYAVHPVYGYPVDDSGRIYRSRKQRRRRICESWVRARYPQASDALLQGAWYRCCDNRVRKVWDCCSASRTRINGDASLTGYCYSGKRVFCVTYYDTDTRC
jgi:hypothetical protein